MVDPLYFLGRKDPRENTIFQVAEIYIPVDDRRVERQYTEIIDNKHYSMRTLSH